MSDSILSQLSPYISFGSVLLAILTWGRGLSSKLDIIESNHLTHIEASTASTDAKSTEIIAGQGRLEKHTEQTNALLAEHTKVLTEIATILQERS